MKCVSCGSENVTVTATSNVKSRGGVVPLWYWLGFVWVIDMCLLFVIYRGLKRSAKKTNTRVDTWAICQDCGKRWRVK